jgi:hypothetical protein
MHAILLAMALVSYSGSTTIPYAAGSTSSIIQPAPTVPANTGYELIPPPRHATVTLAGNVVKPGEYCFFPGMTVADLIGIGGSFVHQADYENLRIVRETPYGDEVYVLNWNAQWQTQILLHPDDWLVVPDRSLRTM